MESMKRLKYLLIINLFIVFSCGEDNVDSNSKIDIDQKVIDTVDNTIEKPDGKENKDSLNSNKNKGTNQELLEVIIKGETYYKKNTSDFRIGDSFVYRTKDKRFDYDIRTGEFLPSGYHAGKVIIKDSTK